MGIVAATFCLLTKFLTVALVSTRIALGSLASSGFLKIEVLLIWTFLAAFYREQIANSGLLITNTILFSVAWCCIIFAENTVKKIRSRYLLKKIFVREILGALLISSFPAQALFYIWYPMYSQLPCVVHEVIGKYSDVSEEYRAAFAIVVAAMILILGLIYQPSKLFPDIKKPRRTTRKCTLTARKHVPVTRSMTRKYQLGRYTPQRDRSCSTTRDRKLTRDINCTCSSTDSTSSSASCF